LKSGGGTKIDFNKRKFSSGKNGQNALAQPILLDVEIALACLIDIVLNTKTPFSLPFVPFVVTAKAHREWRA
jgi:hypothetical protein